MATETDLSRVTTFQHHIDDMRSLVMCKICLKPLYEPFILACGHTYCYGCLRSWFSGLNARRRKKNCPDCRAEVKLTPSPNYILRDLVHMFIGRAELLPEDETVDEHVTGKAAEAELLASDKDGIGLFQGVFQKSIRNIIGIGPIQDFEDGVERCPICTWEIEDGMCNHCGYEPDNFRDWSTDEDDSTTNDERSIATDDMSNRSGYDSGHEIPPQFYAARSLADDVDHSISTDARSELDYFDAPHRYAYEEDETDMDGFIDDHDDDEPDEVDEDAIDDLPRRLIPYQRIGLRGQRYRIPDEDDEDDEDEENILQEEDEETDDSTPHVWHVHRAFGDQYFDDERESSRHDHDESSQDQETNYDESEESSRSPTPVVVPVVHRRRPIVISDSEEEDEADDNDADSHTEGRSQTDGAENAGNNSESSDSGDTAIQSNRYERQRTSNSRKRTRSPDPSSWRAVARPRRDEYSDRQRFQVNNRPGRSTRTDRNNANTFRLPLASSP